MRPFSPVTLVLLTCFVAAGVAAAPGPPAGVGMGSARAHAARTVVRVKSTVPLDGVPVRLRADEASFTNTGFFVGTDGEVLTSLLGLAGCRQITVTAPDGRAAKASVKAYDQPSGLALLQTGLTDSIPFEPAPACPAPGEGVFVAAAGTSASDRAAILTPGTVAEGCTPVRIHGSEWQDLVLASCALRPGSAAAPVLDKQGRLVGVVLGFASSPADERPEMGCYVLTADGLQPILERMRTGHSQRLGWLGVIVAADREGGKGVRILEIMDGAPAEQAGLRRGDVLLEMEGTALDSPTVLAEHITQAGPGRDIDLLVKRREGAVEATRATIGPRPLLICGGMGRAGGEVIRFRWRRSVGALRVPGSTDGAEEALLELFDENEELRSRVRELEAELERLRTEEGPTEPAP